MKFGAVASLALVIFASACTSGNTHQVDPPNQQAIADWMDWHEKKRAEDSAVSELLNQPDGTADYPKAIALMELSKRPASVVDLEVGNTILGAYRQPEKAIMPTQSAIQGIERLEGAAAGEGEGAESAPDTLVRWFTRGAGKALLPNPAIAACWQRVAAKTSSVSDCVSLRKEVLK